MSLANLEAAERKVTSQNGEDGVIEAIFAAIGTTDKFFVEFGCEERECNGVNLIAHGWRGLMMDGFAESTNPKIDIKREFITAEGINGLFDKYGVPRRFDLLSIDIDGNDFWVWRQIDRRPRVVVAEYNAAVPPYLSRTIRYEPQFVWAGTDYFGASLLALAELGRRKGYTLVHCEHTGANSFFVANEVLPAGYQPRPIEAIYRRPNYLGQGLGFRRDPKRQMIDPFAPTETGASA
jgi:hypothetical protein